MIATWDDVALRHGADKSSAFHGYMAAYERWVSGLVPESVLEIGVDCGNSLRTWAEIFPDAEIVGIDIRPECADLVLPANASVRIADATIAADLADVLGPRTFDLIVDDGSHQLPDVLETFKLCWSRLAPGGIYAIEDIPMGGCDESPMATLLHCLTDVEAVTQVCATISKVAWGPGHPGLALVTKAL